MSQEIYINNESKTQGCLSELSWFGMGFIMPCVSFTFYRQATRRKVIFAILFFVLFTTVISSLQIMSFGRHIIEIGSGIKKSFQTNDFPVITIKDGIAEVDAQQPLIIFDEPGTALIIDTTGEITQLDRSRYYQGFLLTRTSIHMLSRGRYQEWDLSELNKIFEKNPIVFDEAMAINLWNTISTWLTIIVFIFLLLWNTLIRFMFISTFGIILWGIISLFRPNTGFSNVLIIGIYSIVPALYFDYLLSIVNIDFFGLQTILILLLWVIVLVFLSLRRNDNMLIKEMPIRGWRAFIGIPMITVFAVGIVFSWQNKGLVSWIIAVITFVAIAVTGYVTKPKQMQNDDPAISS